MCRDLPLFAFPLLICAPTSQPAPCISSRIVLLLNSISTYKQRGLRDSRVIVILPNSLACHYRALLSSSLPIPPPSSWSILVSQLRCIILTTVRHVYKNSGIQTLCSSAWVAGCRLWWLLIPLTLYIAVHDFVFKIKGAGLSVSQREKTRRTWSRLELRAICVLIKGLPKQDNVPHEKGRGLK